MKKMLIQQEKVNSKPECANKYNLKSKKHTGRTKVVKANPQPDERLRDLNRSPW